MHAATATCTYTQVINIEHRHRTCNMPLALLNSDLWIDKMLSQPCLRSLVSYQRCTNCSSVHQTIVPIMCALVKKATACAMSFQSQRTWCFIKGTYQQCWRALFCSMAILPFLGKLASWLQIEKGIKDLEVPIQHGQCIDVYKHTYLLLCSMAILPFFGKLASWLQIEKGIKDLEVPIQHGQCIDVYKHTYLRKNLHKFHSYIYLYIGVFVEQRTVRSDREKRASNEGGLHPEPPSRSI